MNYVMQVTVGTKKYYLAPGGDLCPNVGNAMRFCEDVINGLQEEYKDMRPEFYEAAIGCSLGARYSPRVSLSLTREEVVFLHGVMRCIGGSPKNSPRQFSDSIIEKTESFTEDVDFDIFENLLDKNYDVLQFKDDSLDTFLSMSVSF